eukprot:762537-Hanusia_phi.AAC.2
MVPRRPGGRGRVSARPSPYGHGVSHGESDLTLPGPGGPGRGLPRGFNREQLMYRTVTAHWVRWPVGHCQDQSDPIRVLTASPGPARLRLPGLSVLSSSTVTSPIRSEPTTG